MSQGLIPDFGLLPQEIRVVIYAALVLVVCTIGIFGYFFFNYRKYFSTVTPDQSPVDGGGTLLNLDVAYFREKGKRERQEDSFYISPLNGYRDDGVIACVSDGMGGMEFGDDISSSIVESIENMQPMVFGDTERISDNIKLISNRIYSHYDQRGGATLAMVHVFGNYLNFYSVGDSDIILIRNNTATILNPRQNFVSILIKNLAKAGKQTQAAYANKRSRALVDYMGNINPRVISTKKPIRLNDGDYIIISSDGLTDAIPWNMLPKFVSGSARNTAYNLKLSVKHIKHPKQDNYTAVVMRFMRGII